MKSLRDYLKNLWRRLFPRPVPKLRKSKYDYYIDITKSAARVELPPTGISASSLIQRIKQRGLSQQLQVVKRDDHYCIVRRQG